MLILLSRVFVEDIDEFNTEWTEYYFDTDNPDGGILPVSVQNSSAYELIEDEEVWTNPENGDVYTYDGANGVNKTPGDGTSIYDPPAPPDIAAEYGERYRFEFLGGPTTDTYNVKIKIYEKDYEGAVEEVEGAADAATLEWENAGKLFQPFRGSRLRATLKSSVSRKFAHLFEGDEREYYARLDIDDVTKWTGWIHPDIYSEPYANPPYFSSVNFSDGLAGLKQIDMPDINANGYTGTVSEKNAVIHILKQAALGLDVHFAINLKEDGMDELSAPIEQSLVNMEAFLTYTNGETAPMDCYTALEKMLRSWNAVIFQQDNQWWIVREPELFTSPVNYKRFDKDGTALGTASIADNHLTFAEVGLKLHRATLETVPAFRNISVSQEYGELLAPNGNFIKNGDCEQWAPIVLDGVVYGWNLKYWTKSGLTAWPSENPAFLGSVRRVEESVDATTRNNYAQIYGRVRSFSDPIGYLESTPIPVVQEVGNVIRAKLKLRCNTRSGDDNRLVEAYFNVAIKCGTQWLTVDEEGVYSWTGTETRIRWRVGEVMRWEEITIPPVPIPEDGNLLIRMYQMVQPGSVAKVKYVLDFDNIELGLADNPALANQRIYYVTANPNTYTSKPEQIPIQLGDVATVLSQNAKIIGENPSSGWFRPGESPSQALAALIAREWINQTHVTRTRLRGGECHTILSLLYTYEDTVNESGKKFLHTGGIWSLKSGRWNPDLIELDQTETTIGIRQVTELRNDNQNQGAGGTDNTGAQNPPDPQTTAPENGLEFRGTLVFNSAIEVEVTLGYEWMYDGVLHEGGTATLAVLGTPTTYNRRDALVGDNTGAYHWIPGTEDASGVIDPTIPTNRRLLEYVLRTPAGDNTLEPLPEDDSIYVDKVSTGNQTILSDLTIQKLATGSDNVLGVDSNGKIIVKAGGTGITGSGTANEIAYFTGASAIASLAVATYPSLLELAYVKGVTSAIQTQLNGKQATIAGTQTEGHVATIVSGVPTWAAPAGGSSNWTVVGSDIYRNSSVAIGRTTIGTNNTLSVQSRTATTSHKFVSFYNNAGTEILYQREDGFTNIEGVLQLNTSGGSGTTPRLVVYWNSSAVVNITGNGMNHVPEAPQFGAPVSAIPNGATFRGSANNASRVFEVENNAGTAVFGVAGNGIGHIGNITTPITSGIHLKGTANSTTTGTDPILRLDNANNITRFEVTGNGLIKISEGGNVQLGTATGTKFGETTMQKLAFWNATPIIQPTTSVAAGTLVSNGGTNLTDTDTVDGYTYQQFVRAVRLTGLLA